MPRLAIVPQEAQASERVKKALKPIDTRSLKRHMLSIYGKTGPLVRSALLGYVPPRITGLSASFGMGMELDIRNMQQPVVHLDEAFLDQVLEALPAKRHSSAARYFVLSTIGHAFIKDSAEISAYRDEGAHIMMIHAWKRGARLALDEMGLRASVQQEIVEPCLVICRDREVDYAADMLFYVNKAAEYDKTPPRIRPVEPWVQGLAFPAGFEHRSLPDPSA